MVGLPSREPISDRLRKAALEKCGTYPSVRAVRAVARELRAMDLIVPEYDPPLPGPAGLLVVAEVCEPWVLGEAGRIGQLTIAGPGGGP